MQTFFRRLYDSVFPFLVHPPSWIEGKKATMRNKLAELQAEEAEYKRARAEYRRQLHRD